MRKDILACLAQLLANVGLVPPSVVTQTLQLSICDYHRYLNKRLSSCCLILEITWLEKMPSEFETET